MEGSIEDFGDSIHTERNNDAKVLRQPSIPDDECYCEEKPQSENNSSYSQYTRLSNNSYMSTYTTIPSLPSGMYEFNFTDRGIQFVEKPINTDEWISFPNSTFSEILSEIDLFWEQEKAFKEFGFTHKRGILLYGPAGCGKTILVKQAMHNLISSNKGIVINVTTHMNAMKAGIEEIKVIEPNKKIILLLEDVDAHIYQYGEESLLSFLDGEGSQNNILIIATTNYPEKLDKRIVARPRRFDRRIKISMPNAEMRKIYFERKLNIKDKELEKYVKATEGFSFAAMAELVISTKCLNKDFKESVDIIKELINVSVSSSDFNNKAGFQG
jgi:SpoVK/Ycf46/Vps4 family AAA+-type ATPase